MQTNLDHLLSDASSELHLTKMSDSIVIEKSRKHLILYKKFQIINNHHLTSSSK